MTKFVLGALVVLIALPATAYDLRSPRECAPTVQHTLSAAGIKASNIADTAYLRVTQGGDENVLVGYRSWTRLNSCQSGYMVIDMDLDCSLFEAYTFGECRVNGINEG